MSQRLGATSKNLDDGDFFTLRLPFPGCDACGLLILMHSHRCFSVWRRLGATSENQNDGEIFTLRLPSSGCDACGLLWTPHSNRQAPIKSSKSIQGCHENKNPPASKKSRNYWIPFKTSTLRKRRHSLIFIFLTKTYVSASWSAFEKPRWRGNLYPSPTFFKMWRLWTPHSTAQLPMFQRLERPKWRACVLWSSQAPPPSPPPIDPYLGTDLLGVKPPLK